ncbi:hypothetical protein P7K49_003091 [Saguinus oedipus]|uniref:ARVCF delta catenin family member n=1 Tax=Saguinus oedipus TaxID=9490 RepID=A0ABQ9WJP9_SAGOE|nr:hypothetical protein P7K49_003091 [Saguinus oedipus]
MVDGAQLQLSPSALWDPQGGHSGNQRSGSTKAWHVQWAPWKRGAHSSPRALLQPWLRHLDSHLYDSGWWGGQGAHSVTSDFHTWAEPRSLDDVLTPDWGVSPALPYCVSQVSHVPVSLQFLRLYPPAIGSSVYTLGSCSGTNCWEGQLPAPGKKDGEMDQNFDTLDLPKRTEAAKGFELLYQPEVVRLYLSLLTESRNFNTLEAAAGALQNLSAGNWMWATYIRATVRKERGLPVLVELLQSETDKVVRAVAIALRNLSLDRRNKDLIGSYAMAELVRNLRNAQSPRQSGACLEEDTVVAVLNTIHEIISDSLDNARSLLQARGVPALVALVASSQSVREAKAASHVLQTVWSYKELRGTLQKDGWTKARFQVLPFPAFPLTSPNSHSPGLTHPVSLFYISVSCYYCQGA